MRKIEVVLLLIFVVLVVVIIFNFFSKNEEYVIIGDKEINVEIARTSAETQKGLMYREELCDDCGMLFIFDKEDIHSFWMKNTLIPLDMVFINSNIEVVDVLHAVPCTEDPCESYVPKGNAMYVLETNLNVFDESIIGEKVEISI